MGLPSLNIVFQQLGTTAIQRGDKGIVALILEETGVTGIATYNLTDVTAIPATLSDANKKYISDAFIGYTLPPKKVIVVVVEKPVTGDTVYTDAQTYLETIKWDYIAVPDIADTSVLTFSTWIKSLRDTKHKPVKAVLPHCLADHEGIIDFDTDNIIVGANTYTAKQYCARIAGLIAGTPLVISATYAPLPEVTDCPHLTSEDADTAIDAGKLILINDGRKVKIARAINSLTTTSTAKGSKFKKIKLIDVMDLIQYDFTATIEDNYIGKVPNDYDHKVLLNSAMIGYLIGLESSNLLAKGESTVDINIDAQKAYLVSTGWLSDDGKTALEATDQQIKEANTDDQVFTKAHIVELDTMEDIDVLVTI